MLYNFILKEVYSLKYFEQWAAGSFERTSKMISSYFLDFSSMITKLNFPWLFKKNTQNAAKGVYQFVPIQDFSESWTDEKLYKKYGLNQEEIDFIESMIRPMDSSDE